MLRPLCRAQGEGRGALGTHLELGLIGAAAEFGGGFAGDEASAEKPFAALLYVVGVGVRDGSVRELLLRALAQGDPVNPQIRINTMNTKTRMKLRQ